GACGHVLVVGGGPGMPGAVRLCAEAALRAGAGLVSVATDPAHLGSIVGSRPELMVHGIHAADELRALLERADVVAFGPGLGRTAWAQKLYEIVAHSELPAVWDADALNLLAEQPTHERHAKSGSRIITPHPGEAARLLDTSVRSIQCDRLAAVRSLHSNYDGVTVLKGAGTLIYDGAGAPRICTAGNPGMAAAGIGDALTGVIAALLAQGVQATLAATAGVEIHARAGDRAAESGERGMVALDLIGELRAVVNP
ncbi:MAG TPA: NAD(P)H-hydrate dehydratase, partial [Woeseiaceae bacterium]|nr:NAD(P)H-hydrate dehydratase [Woeseiaceae bacterium]